MTTAREERLRNALERIRDWPVGSDDPQRPQRIARDVLDALPAISPSDREAHLRDLLERCHARLTGVSEGLREDIAYALGWIEDWRCDDCGATNRPHHAFCVVCGAGIPELDREGK